MQTTVVESPALVDRAIDRTRPAAAVHARSGRRPWDLIATWMIVAATALHVPLLRQDLSWAGDDSLHYLNHARNIAQAHPYSDTGYIYSRYSADVGPENYPPAFPLALAPIYKAAGLTSFTGYKVFGLGMLAAMLALTAVWCRRIPPIGGSAAVVAILAFNPVLVQNAVAVLSDQMFAVLAMAALLWIDDRELRGRTTNGSSLIAALLVWAACSTRSAGFAIVGALVLRTVVRRFEGWRPTAIAAGIGVGLTWMTGVLAGGTSAVQGYAAEFAGYDWTTPLRNARYYAGDFATDFL